MNFEKNRETGSFLLPKNRKEGIGWLENQLIKQLNEQDYASVEINDYDALL